MIETGRLLQQRYRIDRQIGQGGMGAVYIATDERFGSTVAIKETLCMSDNYLKAIEREARLLNSLKHIALPRVTDHFLEDDGQFLVMEYIPGDDLFYTLEKSGKPFAVETVLTWADQLLDALDFLHNQENPVIHRDIKPQNLKLTSRGQIILLDFGLAKGNPTDAGNQTAAKSIFGYSRNYASLEQIQGTGTDPRSDLYSLAATLYHLMTGVAPEDALTRAMSVLSQQADPLVPANAIAPLVPAGVAAILQSALDLNASMRPQSAAEMRQMLREHEKYESLATAVSAVAPTIVGNDVLAQKTQLMPGVTTPAMDRVTEAKTEVLPAYASEVTSVRTGAGTHNTGSQAAGLYYTSSSKGGRAKWRIAAAALSAVVLVCGVGAGMYMYNPELFIHDKTREPAVENTLPAVATENPNPETVQPITEGAEFDKPVQKEAVAAAEEKTVDQDAKAVLKNTKTQTKDSAKASAGPDKIVIDGETIYMGNVKVTEGRVETPDTVIDENGVRTHPVPRIAPPQPVMPPEWRYLTPQQRRRLRAIQRKHPGAFPRPTPPNQ